MKKISLLLSLLLVAFIGNAATVTDALTAEGFGDYTGTSYSKLPEVSFTSGAVYTGVGITTAANGIQITSGSKTPGYVGLFTNVSGGTLKNVTVSFSNYSAMQ
ncbi:MAG: hypothetical protein ACI30R_02465 [Sodaliphilus sp.]